MAKTVAARSSSGNGAWGKIPNKTHKVAKTAMGAHMSTGTSLACNTEALFECRSPQNTLYPARTMTAMVKMLVKIAMTAAHHKPALASAR